MLCTSACTAFSNEPVRFVRIRKDTNCLLACLSFRLLLIYLFVRSLFVRLLQQTHITTTTQPTSLICFHLDFMFMSSGVLFLCTYLCMNTNIQMYSNKFFVCLFIFKLDLLVFNTKHSNEQHPLVGPHIHTHMHTYTHSYIHMLCSRTTLFYLFVYVFRWIVPHAQYLA